MCGFVFTRGAATERRRSKTAASERRANDCNSTALFSFSSLYFSRLVAPPAPIRASGTSDHLLDGIGLAGAAWRVSSLADVEKTLNAATAIPATTSAVPLRQRLGSACQPPAGDQTPLG